MVMAVWRSRWFPIYLLQEQGFMSPNPQSKLTCWCSVGNVGMNLGVPLKETTRGGLSGAFPHSLPARVTRWVPNRLGPRSKLTRQLRRPASGNSRLAWEGTGARSGHGNLAVCVCGCKCTYTNTNKTYIQLYTYIYMYVLCVYI